MPKVSFVMPARDEAHHIAEAIESVSSQQLPDGWQSELVVALAPSTDGSSAVLASIAKKLSTDWLRIIENSAGDTASGLNLAIQASTGEVVIRVDGHSKLPRDYSAIGIAVLGDRPEVGNVGGMMVARGDSPLQRAIAWAYGSRWGLGGGRFHVGGEAGPQETVYLGIFRRTVLDEVGGFDVRFVRGQDWELNQRIRAAGHLVWFDPRLKVEYHPRRNLSALASQFFSTGRWRGVITRSDREGFQLRYLAPPLLVLSSLLIIPPLLYFSLVVALAVSAKIDRKAKTRLLVVLPIMHFGWGLGFLGGFLFGRDSPKPRESGLH